MSIGMSVNVAVSPALMAGLRRMEQGVRGPAAQSAVMAGGLVIANEAKRRCPVLTGRLRNSITVRPEGNDAVAVGPQGVPYAARIEFGFVGADRLGRVYHQAARPYLRPAADSQARAAVAAIEAALLALIGGGS